MKTSKCVLVCKPEHTEKAKKIFEGTNIEIVEGHRILGSTIGTEDSMKAFIDEQVSLHQSQIDKLSDIAKTNPQNVYACYTKGVQAKLSFLNRTTPKMNDAMKEVEKTVQQNLLPKMTKLDSIDDETRTLFSLPLKMGGLNIVKPEEYTSSYGCHKKFPAV